MSISLVGVTLHVADVERSLAFYQRLPDAAVLFHMHGKFALIRVGDGRLGQQLGHRHAANVHHDGPSVQQCRVIPDHMLGRAGQQLHLCVHRKHPGRHQGAVVGNGRCQ